MTLFLELAVLLACIVVGARLGGVGLGALGGLGLGIFVFVFGMPPGNPPGNVLGMILAVITALALLESAGGLDYVVRLSERLLRRNARWVTILSPLVTYLLVFASGTQHVVYALLPVIAETARSAGIRPERPLSISVIASQQGLIASPVSAVTVALVATLTGGGVTLPQILLVVIPASLAGVFAGTLSVAFRGVELADDPEYARRLASGEVTALTARPDLGAEERSRAVRACLVFLVAVVFVVLLGIFPGLRPVYEQVAEGITETGQVEMGRAIMIVMMAAAAVLLLVAKADPEKALKGPVMKGGLTAIVSILGVSWMGSSFFEANRTTIVDGIAAVVQARPWLYASGLFALSILLFSQAATVAILGPVAVALGLSPALILGSYPAVNGNFFLPTYGTVLAAVAFDRTGTTRIGKYLLNHSFMRPGIVATLTATTVAMVLARVVLQ
jgi:anaerobic C4-dicarboxylate transporter-like protein